MKKLLSFGINDYPGSQNDLQGCVNDTKNIVSHLGIFKSSVKNAIAIAKTFKSFGFETQVFLNSQVTKEKLRSEVTNLVLAANSGDIIVIHYSGHGTRLIDKNGDESDGYDEALYLYDGAFSDDEFSKIMLKLPTGVECVFMMDSCFSGTITRKINQKARFKPLLVEVDHNGDPIQRKNRILHVKASEMNHLVFSGCSSTQTSADAQIQGFYNGAFTFYAMDALTPGISYKEWHKRFLKKIKSTGYDQTPQIEGPEWLMEKGVFGSKLKSHNCWLKFWQ
jgi:hypothetical protein